MTLNSTDQLIEDWKYKCPKKVKPNFEDFKNFLRLELFLTVRDWHYSEDLKKCGEYNWQKDVDKTRTNFEN